MGLGLESVGWAVEEEAAVWLDSLEEQGRKVVEWSSSRDVAAVDVVGWTVCVVAGRR